MQRIWIGSVLAAMGLLSCTATKPLAKVTTLPQVQYLDNYIIPNHTQFQNTKVGGLSSIDYDEKKNQYYLICDDRSDFAPARFYTANIRIANNRFTQVSFTKVDSFRTADGALYPSAKQNPDAVPDPEEMRYNPKTNQFVWTSEGERKVGKGKPVLVNPAVNICDKDGKLVYELQLPDQFKMSAEEVGPRRNGAFEGATFMNAYKTILVSTEEPLFQDGARAEVKKGDYWCRFIKFDATKKAQTAQYAYPLDPIQAAPKDKKAFAMNGISSILAINDAQVLVVERSFTEGVGTSVRVYLVDLEGAEDIKDKASLLTKPAVKPLSKRLLIDFNKLGFPIDNIEGVTFGPKLANGHRSLIFVSDNNFSDDQSTQLILFDFGM